MRGPAPAFSRTSPSWFHLSLPPAYRLAIVESAKVKVAFNPASIDAGDRRIGVPMTRTVLAALVVLWSVSAGAATISVESKSTPGLLPKTETVNSIIRITGLIEAGDAEKLRRVLEPLRAKGGGAKPLATAQLSSKGGDFHEGLKLGYLFREFDVATVVRPEDMCLSSCALAFLGGTREQNPPFAEPSRTIHVGAKVGFHNFFLSSPADLANQSKSVHEGVITGFNIARGGAAALIAYANRMGIDPAFVARMMGMPPDAWEYVESSQSYLELKVCPVGLEKLSSNLAAIATNVCNHAASGMGYATPQQARLLSQREARRHLLEGVRDTAQALSPKNPFVVQLSAVLASRDDALVETVYEGLRTSGVTLPEIKSNNYEVTGYSLAGTPMDCHVGISRENPTRYDVVLTSNQRLIPPFRKPPAECPLVFLFDPDEALHPSR